MKDFLQVLSILNFLQLKQAFQKSYRHFLSLFLFFGVLNVFWSVEDVIIRENKSYKGKLERLKEKKLNFTAKQKNTSQNNFMVQNNLQARPGMRRIQQFVGLPNIAGNPQDRFHLVSQSKKSSRKNLLNHYKCVNHDSPVFDF